MALLDRPSAASRQMRARSTVRCGLFFARTQAPNVVRCSAVIVKGSLFAHMLQSVPRQGLIAKTSLGHYTSTDALFYELLVQGERGSPTWISQFLKEYRELMLAEAAMAARCGVDVFVLNFLAAPHIWPQQGDEDWWYGVWRDLIQAVRSVFSGELMFAITSPRMADDIIRSRTPPDLFEGVDSFMLSHWSPYNIGTPCDSLGCLYQYFRSGLEALAPLCSRLAVPVVLNMTLQSTDGYFQNGWFDVAIGRVGVTDPDFFEQARACEALFQAMVDTGIGEGVVLYKYHWDDPFGPDLPMLALSRMDLSSSIRNKPAEAVAKRWFSGDPGPAVMITSEQQMAMARPWCPYNRFEVPSSGATSCSLEVDRFDGGISFRDRGWVIDYDCAENHVPGEDPTAQCSISFPMDACGKGYLNAEFRHHTWMKIRYWGPVLDASGFEGVQLTLWGDRAIPFRLEIAAVDPTDGWQVGLAQGFVDVSPRTFRVPFASLVNPNIGSEGSFLPYLRSLMAIGVFMLSSEGTLRIDDICLFGP